MIERILHDSELTASPNKKVFSEGPCTDQTLSDCDLPIPDTIANMVILTSIVSYPPRRLDSPGTPVLQWECPCGATVASDEDSCHVCARKKGE